MGMGKKNKNNSCRLLLKAHQALLSSVKKMSCLIHPQTLSTTGVLHLLNIFIYLSLFTNESMSGEDAHQH